jgi:glyoxylase-like metal-dependent hydrolase (beta-lactamase superfamily II)
MKTFHTSKGTLIMKIAGGRSNIFLVKTGQEVFLIDTGPAFMRNQLLKRLHKAGINSIDYLILTHTHFDHAANAFAIKKQFGAKVIVHASEAEYLMSGDSPVPAGAVWFTSMLIQWFGKMVQKLVIYPPCQADILVNDELSFSDNESAIRIIHTPGHSSGSMCIIIDNEITLAGDTLIGTIPGRCFPPFVDDIPELYQSWQKLLKTECTIFLPSHGSEVRRSIVAKKLAKASTAQPS